MKCVPIEQIHQMDFAITKIQAIYQTPTWTQLGRAELTGQGRLLNGFLLIDRGSCRYVWDGGDRELGHGDLIYLPRGSVHYVTVTGAGFSFYRICFTVTDLADGEQVVFTRGPWVAGTGVGQRFFDLSGELVRSTAGRHTGFDSLSLMGRLLADVERLQESRAGSRITPAVAYIEQHYTHPIQVRELAQLCYLSQPQLFRLFRQQLGTTPMGYRDRLRMERAEQLLRDAELSVGEIAGLLGYESLYYFSRVFSGMHDMSPTEYRRRASVR